MFDTIASYRAKSAAAGRKWTAACDEPQTIQNDMTDEINGYPSGRRDKMWPCLMAGGDGFLWYIQNDGGGHGFDQHIDDFSIMRSALQWSKHIRDFLAPLPLLEMISSTSIVTSASGEDNTLAKSGEVYAVFKDRVGTGMTIDLRGVASSLAFSVQWFDPRNGGAFRNGTVMGVTG